MQDTGTCFAYVSNLMITCYVSFSELLSVPKIIRQELDCVLHLGVLVPERSNGPGDIHMSGSGKKPIPHMLS